VKLSDEDLDDINGRRDRLEETIQVRYGFASDYVHKEVEDWLRWQYSRSAESSASKYALFLRQAATVSGEMLAQTRDLIENLFRQRRIGILKVRNEAATNIFDLLQT
jgi:hypothetical protein